VFVLRLLIPLALVAVVILAVAAAPRAHVTNRTACAQSDRQLASLGCNR
jgi:hypothetical protein